MRVKSMQAAVSAAFAVVAATSSTPAAAAQWMEAGGSSDFTGYIDVDSVTSSGPIGTAWVRIDYKKGVEKNDADQVKVLYEVTCGRNKIRSLASTSYRRGKLVSSTETPEAAGGAVRPESFGETVYSSVCSFKDMAPAFAEWLRKQPPEEKR